MKSLCLGHIISLQGQTNQYKNQTNQSNQNEKAGNNMTLHKNAKFTCERLISEYEDNGCRCTDTPFWDIMKIIKHSFEINAISESDAERYCYHMHITFDEMMTADD